MKKKIALLCICLWEIVSILMTFVIGGQLAPWIWNFNVFVVAPVACIALLMQMLILIVRLIKRKTVWWNLIFVVVTLVMSYPITILFGISVLTYPTHQITMMKEKSIEIEQPVRDGILFGGKSYKSHAVWPSECYAYDIVKEPYNIKSENVNDYGIYLADVICPVTGTVIDVKDDEEDIIPNTEEFKSSFGNYIFIRIEDTGTYLILAHLEKNSVQVKTGDNVSVGMNIAKVGNSGTTSEPHLHIQHQKNDPGKLKIPVCAQGLTIDFKE